MAEDDKTPEGIVNLESVEDKADARSEPNRLFCFGMGYSALVLARRLRDEGWVVAGTCRYEEKRQALADEGFEAFLFNRDQPLESPEAALQGTTHVLSSVPPDTDDPVLDHHRADLIKLESLQWLGYLSTTGVYGDTGGAIVDEGNPLSPMTERARRRILAEKRWLSLRHRDGLPVHIFRLAGIYGPHRSVLDRVRNGTAQRIYKPGHKFSRIHVEDIATVLQASMAKQRGGAVYNVCDNQPATPAQVTAYGCKLLGMKLPPLVLFKEAEKNMSPMAKSFWRDNRRVDNSRLKYELGVSLAYPDYKKGLEAIVEAEKNKKK